MPPKSKRTATKSRGAGLAGRSSARPSRGARGGDRSGTSTRNLIASKINAFVNDPNNPLNNPAYMYGQEDNDNDTVDSGLSVLRTVNKEVEKRVADRRLVGMITAGLDKAAGLFTRKSKPVPAVIGPAIAAAVVKTDSEAKTTVPADGAGTIASSSAAVGGGNYLGRIVSYITSPLMDMLDGAEVDAEVNKNVDGIIEQATDTPVVLDERETELLEAAQERQRVQNMNLDGLKAMAKELFPETANARNAADKILGAMDKKKIINFIEIINLYKPFMKDDNGNDIFDQTVKGGKSITQHLSHIHQFVNNEDPDTYHELNNVLQIKDNRAALYVMLHNAIARNSAFENHIRDGYTTDINEVVFGGPEPYARDFAFDTNNVVKRYAAGGEKRSASEASSMRLSKEGHQALTRKIFLDALNADSPEDEIINLFKKFLSNNVNNYRNAKEPFMMRFQRRVAGL